ncbi:MAG: hypothetical protein M3Q24_01545, partial [bacterium]|nr:hypothetical protein [bacterium]
MHIFKLRNLIDKAKKIISKNLLIRPIFLSVIIILSTGLIFKYTQAATITWDGDGADNNWSTCANWSGDTCPGSSDVATFNATSVKDSTIDTSYAGSVGGINIQSGYTGIITQARSLTIGGSSFSQADGTFTGASQS